MVLLIASFYMGMVEDWLLKQEGEMVMLSCRGNGGDISGLSLLLWACFGKEVVRYEEFKQNS